MIPEREQRIIEQRLRQDLAGRVRLDLFTQRPSPIVIPGRPECRFCEEVREAMQDIAALHPRVSLTVHEFAGAGAEAEKLGVERVPCVVVRGQANRPLRFYGLPGGAVFPVFIESIIMSCMPAAAISHQASVAIKKLRETVQISVFVTPGCQYSGAVADAACRLALTNANVKAEVVEISEFPELVQRFGITATPTTVFDGRLLVRGLIDDVQMARYARTSTDGPAPMTTSDAGPSTPFEAPSIEEQAAAANPAAPRIYVPGR